MEIGVTDNPEDVGFYSGLVESVFAVVQVFTSRSDSSTVVQLFTYLVFQSFPQVRYLTGGEGSPFCSSERPEWQWRWPYSA